MISTTFVHNVRPLSLFPAQLHSADGTGGWHDPLFDCSAFVSNFFKWVLSSFVCVCKKRVCLAEGRCWNHSSSLYNTMPRLTRFGGQGSGVHCQVINRSKFPDYETQGHLGQAQDAERTTTLIIAALAQNSFPYLCSNMTPDFAPNNPCCGWLDPPKLQDVSVAAAVAEREIRCEDI